MGTLTGTVEPPCPWEYHLYTWCIGTAKGKWKIRNYSTSRTKKEGDCTSIVQQMFFSSPYDQRLYFSKNHLSKTTSWHSMSALIFVNAVFFLILIYFPSHFKSSLKHLLLIKNYIVYANIRKDRSKLGLPLTALFYKNDISWTEAARCTSSMVKNT